MLETIVAGAILVIITVGLLPLFTTTTANTTGQGEDATRTTEYAQDKMEQLMTLTFVDGSTDTTKFPSTTTGGTGLGGNMAASKTVGGVTYGTPKTGYVDYLDAKGNLLTSSTGAYYTRQWMITTSSQVDGNGVPRLKTITVVATANYRQSAILPSTTLACIKADF
jgi:hypothetical protein